MVGSVIGVVLGTVFGLIAARGISGDVVLRIPYVQIVTIILGSGLAGVLAALLPSRRAAKVSIVASMEAV
jgi:putative ABC transport system permease protein